MFRRIAFLCALATAACIPVPAPEAPVARATQDAADSVRIAALAHSLTRGASTDSARAARLYQWIASNVSYDVAGYYAGRLSDVSPEYVYRRRAAVCGGFVTLFQRMAQESGLTVAPILGYAKGFDYRDGQSTRKPNHSWAAIRIDNRWRLIDPTWAAGFVVGGKFRPSFTWDYFLVDPDALILSHYPREPEWQLQRQPLTRGEFERMPLVPRAVVNAGFEPAAIRKATLQSGVRDFPLVGPRDYRQAHVISAPIRGTLKRGSSVNVDIYWPGATDVALVSGGSWTYLRRDGNHFRGEAPARAMALQVVGRPLATRVYETLLQYTVQ